MAKPKIPFDVFMSRLKGTKISKAETHRVKGRSAFSMWFEKQKPEDVYDKTCRRGVGFGSNYGACGKPATHYARTQYFGWLPYCKHHACKHPVWVELPPKKTSS